jgi:hypothetical protein
MRLVKAAGRRRKAFVRQESVQQVRDVGARLEYVLARYSSLVREIGEEGAASELNSRLDLINSQLVYVTRRLQEVMLFEHENAHLEQVTAEEAIEAAADFPREIASAI